MFLFFSPQNEQRLHGSAVPAVQGRFANRPYARADRRGATRSIGLCSAASFANQQASMQLMSASSCADVGGLEHGLFVAQVA